MVHLDLIERPRFVPRQVEKDVLKQTGVSGRQDEACVAITITSVDLRKEARGRGVDIDARSRLNQSGLRGL